MILSPTISEVEVSEIVRSALVVVTDTKLLRDDICAPVLGL